jgi:hypothetical protein
MAQFISKYPDIPRIDVHIHADNNYESITNYLTVHDKLLADQKIDLALWINLNGEKAMDTINEVSKGRFLTCISDMRPQRGLTHKPKEMETWLKKGAAGYKIWQGPYYRVLKEGESGIKYFDDPAHEKVLAAMEKVGMPGASVHIADPNQVFGNRGKWLTDPVEYWREIMGMERVLQRHPKLVIVAAHCCWLSCQDAQIDFLRYLMSTYPNFYVDLSATYQYYNLVNYDNLRDFMITFADRILYGTDQGKINKSQISNNCDGYSRTFRILETDENVEGGAFSSKPCKGLNLPKEVLEKIYYKNALKIYPGLADRMKKLGYKI